MRSTNSNFPQIVRSQVRGWISDTGRHLREKSWRLVRRLDKDGDGTLGLLEEVVANVDLFAGHELTRHGDLLYYRDEL